MKKQRNNLHYPLFVAALVAVISGCGGESDDTNNSNNMSQHIVIETRAALDEANIDSLTTIDLSDVVKTEENIELQLDTVTPLSEHNKCSVISMKGLSYTVETDISQVCRFEYTVVPMEAKYRGKAYGSSEVVVSDNGSERIAPIARKTIQGESISIDLSPYLPSGAALNSASLELRGITESGELGSVSSFGNTISYVAPINTSGQVQIYYTALDDTTGMLYSGVIYTAISLDANSAPSATLNSVLEDHYLSEGRSFTVDVSSYISDPDGDELQLTDVYTGENGWARVLPQSTIFAYSPSFSGTHHVTYVVTDKRGGYAIGSLSFDVSSYSSIYDSVNDKTFMAPLTFFDIEQSEGVYSSVYSEDGSQGKAGFYPLFTRSLGESYCTTRGGFLPTMSDLLALFNGELGGQSVWSSQYKWPSGSAYMASDGSVSLFNGGVTSDMVGYVSCLQPNFSATDYSFINEFLQADWNVPTMILAVASDGENEFPFPAKNYALEAEVIDTNPVGLESYVEVEVSNNRVLIRKTSDMVRTVKVKVTDPSVQGVIDETTLIVGLVECPSTVTVADTQVLGCVPVIYARDSNKAFTAALSDAILERIGLDLYQGRPDYFISTNTIPNYTYLNPGIIFSYSWSEYISTAEIHQNLCDIYNESSIGGRVNWVIADTRYDTTRPATEYLVGTFASDLSSWMAQQGVGSVGQTGQGYLVNNKGFVQQVNQYSDQSRVIYQGGRSPYESFKEFSYLTCFSPY